MATLLVQLHVKDFTAWKKGFEEGSSLRSSHGGLSAQIYHGVSDPEAVTVLMKWDSLNNAQKFAGSPDLKAAWQRAGVEGVPSVSFLTEG
jgi:heme-degrading monooxygenase HmoA